MSFVDLYTLYIVVMHQQPHYTIVYNSVTFLRWNRFGLLCERPALKHGKGKGKSSFAAIESNVHLLGSFVPGFFEKMESGIIIV